MKKFCITLTLIIIIIVASIGCLGNASVKKEYLRIHIRANSNEQADLNIKYSIKDLVSNYLTPLIENSGSKQQAIDNINNNILQIERLIDNYLYSNGFDYASKVYINNEKFPTRVYDDLVLEEGYYDALIIELGKARGDNWWCVAYPPLCFSGQENNIEYKSKIGEIFNSFKKRY